MSKFSVPWHNDVATNLQTIESLVLIKSAVVSGGLLGAMAWAL